MACRSGRGRLGTEARQETRKVIFVNAWVLVVATISAIFGTAITASADTPTCPMVVHETYGGQPQVAIRSAVDAEHVRHCLRNAIWPHGFPIAAMPTKVEEGIADPNYSLVGAASMDRLTFDLGHGITTTAFLFHPPNPEPTHTLIIEHGGHEWSQGLLTERTTIRTLVARGYFVLGIPQVLMGRDVTNIPPPGPSQLPDHDHLASLQTGDFHPISLFLDPAVVGLNWVLARHRFSRVAMIGLSGGGWTTTLMAALDPRIDHAYPIAGSVPLYLRPPDPNSGDWEQVVPSLYALANYEDLYLLGGYGPGRSELQVLLYYDSVAVFRNPDYQPYRRLIAAGLVSAGRPADAFQVYLDRQASGHYLSDNALNVILRDLEEGDIDVSSPETTITSGPNTDVPTGAVSFDFDSDEQATFTCTFDDGSSAPCQPPMQYRKLAEGSHRFTVYATDSYGNFDGTPAAESFTVHSPPETNTSPGSSGPSRSLDTPALSSPTPRARPQSANKRSIERAVSGGLVAELSYVKRRRGIRPPGCQASGQPRSRAFHCLERLDVRSSRGCP
jgi:hypothetical protein